MSRRPPVSALLPLLAGTLLLVAGVAMAVAGLAAYQAEAFLRDWQARAAEPSPRAWQVAAAAAERAARWYPGVSGEALDRLGRVHSGRFFLHPLGVAAAIPAPADGAAVEASRRSALAAYRAAVAARPDAPALHAHLAHAKLYLLELDAEFAQALAAADRLGPWQGEVNLELATIGFIAWPALDPAQQALVLAHARRALGRGGAVSVQLRQLAEDAGLLAAVCAGISPADAVAARHCRPARRR